MIFIVENWKNIFVFPEMAARRAAGLVIFRCREGASTGEAEWLLLQTSYGKHHW